MSAGTKRALLISAAVILAAAVLWRIMIEVKSPLRSVCAEINRFGYNTAPDDFYLQGFGKSTSIRKLFTDDGLTEDDIRAIVEISEDCGFDADIDTVGRVELLLWQMDESRVMIVYTLDGAAELVFIETAPNGEVSPIGTSE